MKKVILIIIAVIMVSVIGGYIINIRAKTLRAIECAKILTEEEYNIVKKQENLHIDYTLAKTRANFITNKEQELIKYDKICDKIDSIYNNKY